MKPEEKLPPETPQVQTLKPNTVWLFYCPIIFSAIACCNVVWSFNGKGTARLIMAVAATVITLLVLMLNAASLSKQYQAGKKSLVRCLFWQAVMGWMINTILRIFIMGR